MPRTLGTKDHFPGPKVTAFRRVVLATRRRSCGHLCSDPSAGRHRQGKKRFELAKISGGKVSFGVLNVFSIILLVVRFINHLEPLKGP